MSTYFAMTTELVNTRHTSQAICLLDATPLKGLYTAFLTVWAIVFAIRSFEVVKFSIPASSRLAISITGLAVILMCYEPLAS